MATNYNTITILHNSKIFAAYDSSIHINERIKCDNIYHPQLIPSLPDSSTNWKSSQNHSSLDTFETAKVAAENNPSAVDALDVSARLTQLESSMNDLKVSVGNNHGITDVILRLLENILSEIQNIQVQNVKDNQDIVQAEMQLAKLQVSKTDQQSETQTSVISNLVQQALSLSASAPLQSQQYLPSPINLPQSIHVVSPPNAPPQHGLPPPIQLPNQFPRIPNPTVPPRDPYLPPPVHSQEIPYQQYQLPLTKQPRPQPGAPPHQQYQQTPHSQYSQPPHSSGNPPQLQSFMGHRLEEPPYAPSQDYPPNLRHPPSQPRSRPPPPQQFYGTLPQGYEPLSSISGASYSSGYGTLSGPAEPNRYGWPRQYGTLPQGYEPEPPSSRFGASYSSRYDHYPQLPTARILPQAIPTASAVSGGSGSPGAGNRVSVDDIVDKVATMGFPRDHVRATVRKLTENGQSVDLNTVLDKLMNEGGGDMQQQRGWFGR